LKNRHSINSGLFIDKTLYFAFSLLITFYTLTPYEQFALQWVFFLCLSCLIISFIVSNYTKPFTMPNLKITELITTLRSRQANWVARENHVFLLPERERKQMLGVEPPPGYVLPAQTATAEITAGGASFAPSVDWRNRNGNHVTPVRHQGGCGSCVSFCTVAVTESMASIEKGQLLDLSEADQHFCSNHGAN
jgi:hypothetical protein